MDSRRIAELQRLFEAALVLPAEQRQAFLKRECGSDEEMLARLEAMVATADESVILPGLTGALERALGAGTEPNAADGDGLPAGFPETVGQFRLIRPLGRGGMGAVYLAERANADFTQRVAVKLIRPGWDTPQVTRRFLSERQILAQLEHPGIARFIDGGVTDAGQPYFAMEFIEGTPIDEHCDALRLGVADRLGLFLEACQAVQYAHQRFVVHRDLKPSNILVTPQGKVKLLDFGIATVLAAGDQSGNTLYGTGVGTPFYMSPEQFRADPITAASDVYTLGILLFELLTGTVPHRVSSSHPRDIERVVLGQDAERPSTAIGRPNPRTTQDTPHSPEEVCARRGTGVARLRRALRGDLDAILLKALDRDPKRRYASVQAFADDVSRYLSGHPVEAKPASLGYRLSRTAKRHPWGLGAAAAVTLLLAGYVATLSIQNARVEAALALAEDEAQKSSAVSAFLLDLFRASNPAQTLGDEPTALDLLESGAERAESMEDIGVRSELYHVLGRTYRSLGRYEEALPLMQRAVALRRGPPPAADRDLGASLDDLASILQDLSRHDEAKSVFDEALAVRARLGEDDPDHIETLNNLGVFYRVVDDLEAAEPLVRRTLEARRRIYEPGHPRIGVALNNLASVLIGLGDTEEVETLQREVLEIWRTSQGPDHPDVALALSNLALTIDNRGAWEEAQPLHREALAIRQRVLPEGHPLIGVAMNNLASSLELVGGTPTEEGIGLRREATSILETALGKDHIFAARSGAWLGIALLANRESAEGERVLLDALERMSALDGPEEARLRMLWGVHLTRTGRYSEAVTTLRESIRNLEEAFGPDHEFAVRARETLEAALEGRPPPDWESPASGLDTTLPGEV